LLCARSRRCHCVTPGCANLDSYEIYEPTIISLGPDQALLRYIDLAHRSGPYTLRALMVSVYVRVQEQWRLVHYQQTSMPTAYTANLVIKTRAVAFPK